MDGLQPRALEIFLSAGEASGDLHASALTRRLKAALPSTRFTCLGGPALARAGANVLVSNRDLAVVGLVEVLKHARAITDGWRTIRRYLCQVRPDLVILIDFPDFNFLLMRLARRLGIPVFYFISPQVWAWRRGRVRALKRMADDLAVILPFEVDFYRSHGMKVHYVGHPLLDILEAAPSREEAARRYRRGENRRLVGLLPGSRRGEIAAMLPVLMGAAELMAARRPDVDFILPLAPDVSPELPGGLARPAAAAVSVVQGDTHGVIRACDLILAVSGTVTLEAAILGTPMIITYKVSPLSYRVGRRLIRVDRAGLPNLIAGRMIAPELLQDDATPEGLAREALDFLDSPGRLERQRRDLAGVREILGKPGAVDRTADLVLKRLAATASRPPRGRRSNPGREILPAWIRGIYGLGWSLIWPHALLYYRLRSWTDGKYAESGPARLGLHFPAVRPASFPLWVHALSVGETLSSAPLVRALKERWPEVDIVFSTATETGQRLARKTLSPWVRTFFYMPHDLPWLTEGLARRIQPRWFIQVETDLWPSLLCALHRHGIPSALVNGRLSPRSFRGMMRMKGLWGPLLTAFQAVFAQSEADRDRYMLLGVEPHRIHVSGNLKFDAAPAGLPPGEVSNLRDSIGLPGSRPVWIAGSTHQGEEEALLRVHAHLRRDLPDLFLILAPRQPARAGEVADLCRRRGLKSALRSRGETSREADVLILDSLGELGRFYAAADVAFIGGSWVPLGGHNPLEAAAQGKPACWGPHLFNFREMESELLGLGGYRRVASESELHGFLRACLTDPVLRGETLWRARTFLGKHQGVAERLAEALLGEGRQV
ncbi:MAG: lipid-A-disaccharide synthase [Syntrophobacteraceae bacterium]|jgi:lipid-A-disaccharide synthase|nr:lipid-A-disaccharide synthase [Syntrophobacteraceae bacterium]